LKALCKLCVNNTTLLHDAECICIVLRRSPSISCNQVVGEIDGGLDADDEVILCAGDQVRVSNNDLFRHTAEVLQTPARLHQLRRECGDFLVLVGDQVLPSGNAFGSRQNRGNK
jgi:hypothetical protein